MSGGLRKRQARLAYGQPYVYAGSVVSRSSSSGPPTVKWYRLW